MPQTPTYRMVEAWEKELERAIGRVTLRIERWSVQEPIAASHPSSPAEITRCNELRHQSPDQWRIRRIYGNPRGRDGMSREDIVLTQEECDYLLEALEYHR